MCTAITGTCRESQARRSASNSAIRANLAFRRTGEISMRARLLVVAASLSLLTGAADSEVRCSGGAYSLLRRDFHETVKYLPADHAIEFCPDNTCHRFVSRRASCDDLAELLLMYLRYYSDYAVLTDWRRRDARVTRRRVAWEHPSRARDACASRGSSAGSCAGDDGGVPHSGQSRGRGARGGWCRSRVRRRDSAKGSVVQ